MGRLFGYARVSSKGQDVTIQEDALRAYGCERIDSEKVSGTSMKDRVQLRILLEQILEKGDTLVVTKIDRLARSLVDLQTIALDLKNRGIGLKVIEQPIDTSKSAGKIFFDMLAAFAEFETAIRKERQADGIEKAKAEGVYKGRERQIDRAEVLRLLEQGKKPAQIASDMGISRMSVYRILNENAAT